MPATAKKKEPIGRDEERDFLAAGSKALAAGDYDKLQALAEEAIARGPERDYAFHWLAIAHRSREDHAKALEAIDRAIALAPEKTSYLEIRLPLLIARAEARRAIEDAERVYGRETASVNTAIRELTREMSEGSPQPALLIQRGVLFHIKRNYPQAAADFRAAERAGNLGALYFLALALRADERPDEAAVELRRFIEAYASMAVANEARALLEELKPR